MITYDEIQRIYRLEKNSPSLQKIQENFYKEISEMLPRIDKSHRAHVITLLKEIYLRRRYKIILHALRTEDETKSPINIIPDELEMYNGIVKSIKEYNNTIILNRLKTPEEPEKSKTFEILGAKTLKVKILSPLPALLGSDLTTYGPFKEDDIVELPEDNAKILISKEIAEEI